jgi:hypothetical protein
MKSQGFNSVTRANGKVIKRALSDYGKYILKRELGFFEAFPSPYFPRVFSVFDDGYEMEYIEGVPLWKVEWTPPIQAKVTKALVEIHSWKSVKVSREYYIKQILRETVAKIRRRNEQTLPVPVFSKVNGQEVDSFEKVIEKIENYFTNHNRSEWIFTSIHGDLNFGNILYTGSDIRIIDPRGYFGESVLVGPEEYDMAKIIFSLSGYDHLYNNTVPCETRDDELLYDLPIMSYETSEFTQYMMISIWLASSLFFNENDDKRLISRHHGLYLASRLI